MIQYQPICFGCEKPVEYDPVYAPPWCDMSDHPSAVFHGICLMEHRDRVQRRRAELAEIIRKHQTGECDCFGEEP